MGSQGIWSVHVSLNVCVCVHMHTHVFCPIFHRLPEEIFSKDTQLYLILATRLPMALDPVLVSVLQTNRIGYILKERDRKREIYHKGLAHVIIEAKKSPNQQLQSENQES